MAKDKCAHYLQMYSGPNGRQDANPSKQHKLPIILMSGGHVPKSGPHKDGYTSVEPMSLVAQLAASNILHLPVQLIERRGQFVLVVVVCVIISDFMIRSCSRLW